MEPKHRGAFIVQSDVLIPHLDINKWPKTNPTCAVLS